MEIRYMCIYVLCVCTCETASVFTVLGQCKQFGHAAVGP